MHEPVLERGAAEPRDGRRRTRCLRAGSAARSGRGDANRALRRPQSRTSLFALALETRSSRPTCARWVDHVSSYMKDATRTRLADRSFLSLSNSSVRQFGNGLMRLLQLCSLLLALVATGTAQAERDKGAPPAEPFKAAPRENRLRPEFLRSASSAGPSRR